MAALFPPTGGGGFTGPPPANGGFGGHGGPPPLDFPSTQAASPSDTHSLIAFGVVMTSAAIVAVGARLYTRLFIAHRIGTDDYMAVGALVRVA
jgi:hypothetical protein